MSTTTTPTHTADGVPNDGKKGQEIKEEHTFASLKKDGLLHSTCYSSYFPDGIKTFSPWTRIPNAVPCHYDPFEYDKLRKNQKCKQIERSKIFEYMCMSYLLNNFVQNQTVVSTIPRALQEIYKLSVSAAPFFNLRYQPYLFITDNTALYDVNFERFYDCTDAAIIERHQLETTKAFEKVQGIDCKVNGKDGWIEGADFIRAIHKYLNILESDDQDAGYRQIIGIYDKNKENVFNHQAFVSKIYMFNVNKELLSEIFSSYQLLPTAAEKKNWRDDLYKHLFNLKLARIIFNKGSPDNKNKEPRKTKIIYEFVSGAGPVMDMFRKRFLPEVERKAFEVVVKNKKGKKMTELYNQRTQRIISKMAEDNPNYVLLIPAVELVLDTTKSATQTEKKEKGEAFSRAIQDSQNFVKGLFPRDSNNVLTCLDFKPCSLQRTTQIKFAPIGILEKSTPIPSCCSNTFEYTSGNPNLKYPTGDYPTLLFGQIGGDSMGDANDATTSAIQTLDQLVKTMKTNYPARKSNHQGKLGFRIFVQQCLGWKNWNRKQFVSVWDTQLKEKLAICMKTHIKRGWITDLKVQPIRLEFDQNIDNILTAAYDYYYKQEQSSSSSSPGETKQGGGRKKTQMGGGYDNKIFITQLLLFQLYSVTNLNNDLVNRNRNNPIWEIIIQLVNNMMNRLKGIDMPLMNSIDRILGKYIEEEDEEEFFDLVYAPINSVISALKKLKARERREVEVQAAYDVAQKYKKARERREEAVQAAYDVAQKHKMKALLKTPPVRTSGFYTTPQETKTRKEIDSRSTEPYRGKNLSLPSMSPVPYPNGSKQITPKTGAVILGNKGIMRTGGRKKRTKRKKRKKKKKKSRRKKRK